MNASALKECLDNVACPTCHTKVILTKERILFCQHCLVGYPLQGEIPDFRQASAIHFKQMMTEGKTSLVARFTVQNGKSLKENFSLERGQCIVLGRAARLDPDSDITYFGMNENAPIHLGGHTQQLIEKFLAQSGKRSANSALEIPMATAQRLGGFDRVPDIFLDDRSVSRAHAVFYQDDDGVWVLDLVSKNGTYVNGREVERTKLKHNDMVSLGTVGIKIKLR